jgi:CRISPR-associated endonuclease/helicase Cas3
MDRYFAHSGRNPDKSDWQPLPEHLERVASLACEMAAPLGLKKAAKLAGLLHDLGKYSAGFQRRLEGGPSVDHSTAGACVMRARARRADCLLAELVAYAILGHHAGLPNKSDDTDASFDRRIESFRGEPEAAWRAEVERHADDFALDSVAFGRTPDDAFRLSVLGRMLFSCLVDADFKETEDFYARLTGEPVDRNWPLLQDVLPHAQTRFDAHMRAKSADGELNALRRDILVHVQAQAAQAPGLFTLTVPTGGGKTLTSLGFALDHARAHGLRRIIYAIPFTSIIDQTVNVFREVLGDDLVLAHHSAIEEGHPARQGEASLADKRRLAMEDWAAPIVVTTNVQFFESLFAARPSRARKLHNIAGSVIILDEAQTLPRHLLMPVLRMLEQLCAICGCSIVLCTATQPAFDKRNLAGGLTLEGRELAPDPRGLARRLRRATILDGGEMDNEALTAALAGQNQALVIVNSRKHALELFRAADAAGLEGLVHLTTRQCAAHRREILADLRSRLKAEAPCRVVATSLVEAGVDIDFSRVWRARAGLDQIVQAAGRCNREGRRDPRDSIVTVFAAPDYPPPLEIRRLVEDMKRMRAHDDLLSLEAIENYFQEVYWRMGDRLDAKNICKRFSISLLSGTDFAYRSVADDFRMIESGMAPVIVPYDDIARKAVDKLGVEAISSGALARELQPYIVQTPPAARRLLIDNGYVAFASPKQRGEQFAVLSDMMMYKPEIGLLWEDAAYLVVEDCQI